MSTARAATRSIAGISEQNLHTPRLGLISDERLKLGKGPIVEFPSLFASCLNPLADVN